MYGEFVDNYLKICFILSLAHFLAADLRLSLCSTHVKILNSCFYLPRGGDRTGRMEYKCKPLLSCYRRPRPEWGRVRCANVRACLAPPRLPLS